MHRLTVTFATLLAVGLFHFSYVDFRFRHRGSVLWFWLGRPSPPLLSLSRAAIMLCLLAAVAIAFVGPSKLMAVIIAALMLLHVVSLMILETREQDWSPPSNPPA